jgi:hypothetical protein
MGNPEADQDDTWTFADDLYPNGNVTEAQQPADALPMNLMPQTTSLPEQCRPRQRVSNGSTSSLAASTSQDVTAMDYQVNPEVRQTPVLP